MKKNKIQKFFSEEFFQMINLKEPKTAASITPIPKEENPFFSSYIVSEVAELKMRLYAVSKNNKYIYFTTENELINYIQGNEISYKTINIIDFLGNCANKSDVIRVVNVNQKILLYTPCDEDGYGIYNEERSNKEQSFIWEYHYGNISEFYSEFRKRGINFQDDIYATIEKRNQKLLKLCKEHNFFHCNNN